MSDIAIRVENLGKAYHIGLKEETSDTIAGVLASWVRKPLKNIQRLRRLNTFHANDDEDRDDILWALKDVSFDVKQGEVLGVIGRNGAGKSTLLKILSRITEPTKGRATIHGRVSSLLEVGTGFHPELTGRENVYLNGTILGMTKREIDRKFDEIVDFSGVEKFLDTPVKRYSSGMKVRLAFSVAAHLDPEILVIDEVLAVGDAEFQKKCLGKMDDVSHSGRTVLFVSHNLGAVKELCQTSIVLDQGVAVFHGTTLEGIGYYTHATLRGGESTSVAGKDAWHSLQVNGALPGCGEPVLNSEPFRVGAQLRIAKTLSQVRLICVMEDSSGNGVVHHYVDGPDLNAKAMQAGDYNVSVAFPPLWLMPDAYTLYFKAIGTTEDGAELRELSQRVLVDITDTSKQASGKVRATLIPPLEWTIA